MHRWCLVRLERKEFLKIKPIKGHDGYFISDDGKVYSSWVNKGRHGLVKEKKLKRLKGSKMKSGHTYFRFGRKEKPLLLHRIVYENFVGEIPEDFVIRHLNDNPEDNHLNNLAIGTQKDNMQDALHNNKIKIGEDNPNSKLTNEDVIEIRKLAETMTHKEVSKLFDVSRSTISRVVRKDGWGHVN